MAVDPDPRSHISSTTDFYDLLNIPTSFSSPDELRRAFRKRAGKFHPDKAVRPDASDIEKQRARETWDLFEVAVKVLEDASLRSQYDNARAAREQRKQRDAKNDAIRQAMVNRLEKREAGAKIAAENMDLEAQELKRLAQIGREAREALAAKRRTIERVAHNLPQRSHKDTSLTPEDLTVKVRYLAEADVDVGRLEHIFSPFGVIEAVLLGQIKNERVGENRSKRPMGRGFVQFKGRIGAYDAVHEWKDERNSVNAKDWEGIEDVSWLSRTPPAWLEGESDSRGTTSHESTESATMAQTSPLRSSRNPTNFLVPTLGSGAPTLGSWKPTVDGRRRFVPYFPSFPSSGARKAQSER